MTSASRQQQVISDDGTAIGYRRLGAGPPLVMVHGAWVAGDRWLEVAELLADDFECYVMDRRARGLSADGADYGVDREIEDIAAVLDESGSGSNLLGHSSGAIYALETARRNPVERLVAYEPPLLFQGPDSEELLARIAVSVEQGDPERATAIFFEEEVGLPEEAMASLKTTAEWAEMVSLSWTFVREWEALHDAALSVERFSEISSPTLLLGGTETRNHPSFAITELEQILPDATIARLEGQGHLAHQTAPELVAAEVRSFLQ